ncbi:MAG: DUF2796 domain-containing protein [Alphaproteobacteria bacterium]|nr:DUF2796 domain-containing protein [Alphaproteobacteria bacterium]
MKRAIVSALASLLISIAAAAGAEERREASPHQHGHGTLNIAIDGDKALFDMRVPGADVIGFEHAAASDQEKATLAAAKEVLGDPRKVVEIPEAAGCTVDQSFVHYTKDPEHAAHHENENRGKDHRGRDGHDGGHHGNHHAGHAGHQPGHAEFHVGFQLTCLSPENLSPLRLGYFDRFANAQSLEVNVVTANGQSQTEAKRDNATIDLGARM